MKICRHAVLLTALLTLSLPATGEWIRELDVFATHAVTSMPDGRVLILVERGLVILDAAGNVTRSLELQDDRSFFTAAVGSKGEVIAAGGDPEGGVSVLKLTPALTVEWSRRYTNFGNYPIVDVIVASDGDIVVFGGQGYQSCGCDRTAPCAGRRSTTSPNRVSSTPGRLFLTEA